MSEKNQEGKRAARERLREQREKEEARARRGRTVKVAGGIALALAIAGTAALIVSEVRNAESGPVLAPVGAVGEESLAVPVGAADAPSTLTIYEDFRCPACKAFESGFRDTIHELQDAGRLRTEYHLVTIIDNNLRGDGSLNAANAAACAQDRGRFTEYHDTLFENQPEESDDRFADKDYLVELAAGVKGLKTPEFTACVNEGSHDGWVEKNTEAFAESGHRGTPAILLNGEDVYSDQSDPLTPDRLKALVTAAAKGKKAGTATPAAAPGVASGSTGL